MPVLIRISTSSVSGVIKMYGCTRRWSIFTGVVSRGTGGFQKPNLPPEPTEKYQI